MKKKYLVLIDSGIGGLSIFSSIKKLISNKINCIYIMDNKKFPYSNKNYIYITKRILKIIKYLNKIYIIKLLIIACNTASIISLNYIKKKFSFKIIGIFPPIKKSIKKNKEKKFLLLGTYITINSKYIRNTIKKIKKKTKILKKYSLNLIYQSENKIKKNKINIIKIKDTFKNILKKNKKPDIIIIGCTHFTFLIKEFNLIFKKKIICVDYTNIIKKKIYKYINKINIKNIKYIFFYTKKEKFTKIFLNKLKFKYKFNIIKKIKI